MDCKHCGTPAAEGAIYCYNCGKRVDGKKICPTCGEANEDGYKFCIHCGTRIDGKTACKRCGTEHEGSFCPNCGTKNVGKETPKTKAEREVHNGNTYSKVMRIVALSCGAFAAFTAFVFMFFIGFEGNKTVFYYFKDSFQNLKAAKASYAAVGGAFKGAVYAPLYFEAIATCAIAAATLIGVTTFTILTAVRFACTLCGKQTRSPMKTALWAAFSYVLGASLLCPFGGGELVGIKIGYNGATTAGLIITLVALTAAAICAVLTDLQKCKQRAVIARLVRSGICIVMGLAAFFTVRNAGLEAVLTLDGSAVDVSGSHGVIGGFLLGLFGKVYAKMTTLDFEMALLSVYSILGTELVLAAIVFALLAVFKHVRVLMGEDKEDGLVAPITSAVFTVGALIVAILLWVQADFIVDSTGLDFWTTLTIKGKYTLVILAVVFAVVYLGVAIANKIVAKKYPESDEE